MFIAGAIALCIVLLIVSFLAPTLSKHPQRGVNKVISFPRYLVSLLPGPLGRWAAKPFDSTQKHANRSASKGREARSKLPL